MPFDETFAIGVAYLIQILSGSAMVFYAFFNNCTDHRSSLNFRLMLIPFTLILSSSLFVGDYRILLFIILADLLYYSALILSLIIGHKFKDFFIISLSLTLPMLLFAIDIDILFNIKFTLLAIIDIILILIYVIAASKAVEPNDFTKSQVLVLFSVLVLIFLFNVFGLYIFVTLRFLSSFFSSSYLVRLTKAYKEQQELRYKRILEDFDDEVRKKVKTQLFYMEQTQERMAEMAKVDSMTGVLNRKAILHILEDRILDKRLTPFSLLLFDIDRFKLINDKYGHVEGDKCIVRVAKAAEDCVREGDKVGRYGGDEFFVMLSGADIRTAIEVAHRLRKKIEDLEEPKITISIGIASYPADARTLKELIAHADAGLYQAKEKGRNTLGYAAKRE